MKVAKRTRTRMQTYWKYRGRFMSKLRQLITPVWTQLVVGVKDVVEKAKNLWSAMKSVIYSYVKQAVSAVIKGGVNNAQRRYSALKKRRERGDIWKRELKGQREPKVVGIHKRRQDHLLVMRARIKVA
jgi:hypothetical protein